MFFKHGIFFHFQDVNCTDIKTVESPDNTVALETPNDTLTTDKLEEEEFEFDEKLPPIKSEKKSKEKEERKRRIKENLKLKVKKARKCKK